MDAAQEEEDLRGRGESLAGQVSAVIGTDGLLEDLRLNPRSLRLGSEELAEHILLAVRAAQEDQLARAGGHADVQELEGIDPAELMRRLDELEVQAARDFASLNSTLDETLRLLEGR